MSEYKKGFKDGIPIGLGYLAVSFSFGIMGVKMGLGIFETLLISMTNLTSAGQFAGLNIIVAGGAFIEMFVTQLVINLRYALMSIALSQKVTKSFNRPSRFLLGMCITDEIFGVASSRKEPVGRRYFVGLSTAPYIGWSVGTLLGAISGDLLPASICTALGVGLYGMFIAIVVPPMKKQKRVAFVASIAIVISCVIYYQPWVEISSGFAVIISSLVASVLGAIIYPVEDENTTNDDKNISSENTIGKNI